MLDAVREAAMAEAVVRPELAGSALAVAGVAILALWRFGAATSVLGVLAVAVLVAVTTPARRAGRRARESAWSAHARVGAATRTLLEAALELRAHDSETAYGRALLAQAELLAEAERRVLLSSAWVASFPALVGVTAWCVPRPWLLSLAGTGLELAVIGGAGLSSAIGFVSVLDQWQRSAPYRAAQGAMRELACTNRPARSATEEVDAPPVASLRVTGLSVRHPNTARLTPASLSFRLESGGLALVGENGSGKSTALAALMGLIEADGGRIEARDRRGRVLELGALRRGCAFLPQRPHVDVGASVGMHLDLFGTRPLDPNARRSALDRMDVAGLLESRARSSSESMLALPMGKLSGGERQRVLIARVIGSDADLLVLDEPEAGLDGRARQLLSTVLEEEARHRLVILVAHDMDVVPPSFARVQCSGGIGPNEGSQTEVR